MAEESHQFPDPGRNNVIFNQVISEMDKNNMISSPCRKICHLDLRTGSCKGCKRTIDEIKRWPAMSDDEKMEILEALKTRVQTGTSS